MRCKKLTVYLDIPSVGILELGPLHPCSSVHQKQDLGCCNASSSFSDLFHKMLNKLQLLHRETTHH